ncbi:hypothetical protein BH24ACT11_BH24ACT11_12940 [soil metagenome]
MHCGKIGVVTVTDELRRRWSALLPGSAGSHVLGEGLLERWGEPHRHHHDQRHLLEVLAAVDVLVEVADNPLAVRLGAWFHDVVYAGRPDDEELSAKLALETLSGLGLDASLVTTVASLVRMTRDHDPAADDHNGCVLSDADLAVLGASPQRYRSYVAGVRKEYAHVSDQAFRAGRAEVLRTLLAQPQLFRTADGRARWEAPARQSMHAELTSLTDS